MNPISKNPNHKRNSILIDNENSGKWKNWDKGILFGTFFMLLINKS
jgi:hypothetical protein